MWWQSTKPSFLCGESRLKPHLLYSNCIQSVSYTHLDVYKRQTKTSENVKDLLSADDINGFSFNPVRNKAVVELIFKVPNISKYEVIIVEHGDSAHGFTPCLTINLKEEKNLSESFTKIDKYPLPYTVRTFYLSLIHI